MIKARALVGKNDTVFFGLSQENIDRLLKNQPILFEGSEVGLPDVRFCILGGETLGDIVEDLRSIGVRLP